MKTLHVAIGIFFTMTFMGAGCVSSFASIYLAMSGDLWFALASFVLGVGCWGLMLITIDTMMMHAEYPSPITGNKSRPRKIVDSAIRAYYRIVGLW